MTEPNEPEKEVEKTESSNDRALSEPEEDTAHETKGDEEIIDLLHAAEESPAEDQNEGTAVKAKESTDDNEIIDLVNAVEPKEPTEEEAPIELKEEVIDETKDDDEIIDLVNAAEANELAQEEAPIELKEEVIDETKEDDKIIDLVDVTEEISIKDDTESIIDDVSELAEDEGIVDLTESISDAPQEIEEIGESILEPVDDLQELDTISEFDDNLIEEAFNSDDELATGEIVAGALEDDFADSLGVELDSNEDTSEDIFETEKVSDEQVEAALERVIKKVFYEKIDRLLVETIEKTVTKEIERLKKALLDDSADGEK